LTKRFTELCVLIHDQQMFASKKSIRAIRWLSTYRRQPSFCGRGVTALTITWQHSLRLCSKLSPKKQILAQRHSVKKKRGTAFDIESFLASQLRALAPSCETIANDYHPCLAKLLFENIVFGAQVIDRFLLLPIHPASKQNRNQLPGLQNKLHPRLIDWSKSITIIDALQPE
jgi:hypothetical protein